MIIMKKGFTLVEAISVIIIIGIIAIIAFPITSSTIKNSREKAYNAQKDIVVEASKKWAVKNVELLPSSDESINVNITTLIEGGFIKNTENSKLKNPIDNSDMEGCVYITYSSEYNQHIYEYKEVCE